MLTPYTDSYDTYHALTVEQRYERYADFLAVYRGGPQPYHTNFVSGAVTWAMLEGWEIPSEVFQRWTDSTIIAHLHWLASGVNAQRLHAATRAHLDAAYQESIRLYLERHPF